MRSHAIACDIMRSHEIAWDRMRSRIIPFSGRIEFDSDLIRSHEIACDRMRSHAIACDLMRSHAIACDRMKSQTLSRQLSEFLKMHREREAGQKVCSKVFLHDNCEQISYNFFRFLKKEEIRSGTHFTQRNVFLLFTVVVTKHVWPYFQSRFPKTSSKRVSSRSSVNEVEGIL